jgi:hypothetical protein
MLTARTHYQDRWEAALHHAMQAAIGEELKAKYEPPTELTPELSVVLTKLDDPKGGRK